ncbi:hypothetical protein [Arthrobacter tecti]
MIALVGDDGEVTVSTYEAEFDRVITVVPHRHGAMPFAVRITDGFVVVIDGPDLGWWTLGGDKIGNDGVGEAWEILQHLIGKGGIIRSGRRSCEFLSFDGGWVSGPHRDGVRTRRTKDRHFKPFREPVRHP